MSEEQVHSDSLDDLNSEPEYDFASGLDEFEEEQAFDASVYSDIFHPGENSPSLSKSLASSNQHLGHSKEVVRESLLSRLRLLIWLQHEPLIAAVVLTCLLGMSAFFIQRAYVLDGLIKIDQSAPLDSQFLVDINHAELGEIVVLPGVGKKLAQAIIDFRQFNGKFKTLDGLQEVPGIGEKKIESLLPYLVPIESNQNSR